MSEILTLTGAIGAFLESCGRDYEFPAGGSNEILTPSEAALLSALSSSTMSDSEKIATLTDERDWDTSYSLVIFGMRLAILAVRNAERKLFSLAVLPLLAGSPKVDWRDVLGALAVFENCGTRLGVRFQAELESLIRFTDEQRLRPTVDDYFSRPNEMRALEVMGLRQIGSDENLSFKSIEY